MIYPQQQAYKEAKQAYDRLYQLSGEKQNKILDTWEGDLTSEDELERYAEIATHIEFEIGLPQATQALRKAEDELIAWGLAYCKDHPDYTPVLDILGKSQSLAMRERVCQTMLCLGLFDRAAGKDTTH